MVHEDGSPAIGDFGDAEVPAGDWAIQADRVQLLVTTALAVGNERATAAAAASLGNETLRRDCSPSSSRRRSIA